MSETTLRKIGQTARAAGIQAAWAQWASLGAGALQGEGPRASSIIDPEALLLLSVHMEQHERRLRDFVRWWAGVGSELLSVQRTKTLLPCFPPETQNRLGAFAYRAVKEGDKRWRRFVPEKTPGAWGREGKGAELPRLDPAPALLLRLRAGFGVSAKADVLAYLLGIQERAASKQEVEEAIGYSRATVRSALRDMDRAGFVRKTTGRPARYFAPVDPWIRLLGFGDAPSANGGPPTWRYWEAVFAFLAQADRWAQEADEQSRYLLSSQARDLFERHASAFEDNRIQVPRPETLRGPAYLEGFQQTVATLAHWMRDHL